MSLTAKVCSAACQRKHDQIRARERRQALRKDGTSQWRLRASHWDAEQWARFRLSKRVEGGRASRSKEYAALVDKPRRLASSDRRLSQQVARMVELLFAPAKGSRVK